MKDKELEGLQNPDNWDWENGWVVTPLQPPATANTAKVTWQRFTWTRPLRS